MYCATKKFTIDFYDAVFSIVEKNVFREYCKPKEASL